MCSLILKMEEEDPNMDFTSGVRFQRLFPMAVAYVLPIVKMEEEDPDRDPQEPTSRGFPLCQWLLCSLS